MENPDQQKQDQIAEEPSLTETPEENRGTDAAVHEEKKPIEARGAGFLFSWLTFVFIYCCLAVTSSFFSLFDITIVLGNLFAFFTFLAVIPVWIGCPILYLVAGFSRQLPRKPVYLMSWTILVLLMVHIMLSVSIYAGFIHSNLSAVIFNVSLAGLFLNLLQLTLVVVCLGLVIKYKLSPYEIKPVRPIRFLAWNLAVLALGIPLYIYATAFFAVDNVSGGFIRLYPSGIYSIRKTYVQNGKQVILMGMVHVGGRDFFNYYASLAKSDEEKETCAVLVEGVTDNRKVLKHKFDYKGVSEMVGLRSQSEAYNPKAKPRENWIHADVDISDFSEQTIEILQGMGRFLAAVNKKKSNAEIVSEFIKFNKLSQDWTEDDYNRFYKDILQERNRHLFAVLKEHLPEYQTFIIPWGAAHLADAARRLEEDGFEYKSRESYAIVRFF